jgi:hypothetical protein
VQARRGRRHAVHERPAASSCACEEALLSVAGMRGLQKATLWMMGVLGSLGTVGKFLHWF